MTKSRSKPKQPRSKAPKPKKSTASHERSAASSKTATLLGLLSKPEGATIEAMSRAAGWQAHSVRGFLAGQVRKKLGLKLSSEKDADGVRRYRVAQS